MNAAEQEIESARCRQAIARAMLRRERSQRLSYRLGYLCGRLRFYWNLIVRRRRME